MQISRRSWHYRVAKWYLGQSPMPRTLCGYCWLLVVGIPVTSAIFVVCAVVCAPIIFIIVLAMGASDAVRASRRARSSSPQPSLIRAWIRAMKQRVCPILEWTD